MRRFALCLACVLICACFFGCKRENGDYFAPFRGEFAATVTGEWQGAAFSARFCRDAEGGTVTFYAPQALCDTLLVQREDGIFLQVGELSLPLTGARAESFGMLLALFPCQGEIREITQAKEEICVTGEGFCFTLGKDGVPISAQNAVAHVRISAWEA